MNHYTKYIVTTFAFLIPKIGLSQKDNQLNIVEYNVYLIQENKSIIKSTLYLKNKKSIHLYSNLKAKSGFDEQNFTFNISPSKDGVLFYKNFDDGTVTYKDYIFSKPFIVKDSIPKFFGRYMTRRKQLLALMFVKKPLVSLEGEYILHGLQNRYRLAMGLGN